MRPRRARAISISFLKYDTIAGQSRCRASAYAIGWGVSQSGRFLRHFLYQGFNEDEQGRKVFDGVFDQVGGAGRGSFNHRFGQASRDALQYFNILFPVDLFPFTDGPETDPETGATDSLLARAERNGTAPKSLPPADQLGVLQPRRLARPHRSDRHEGRRAAGEHARLHDRVGAARAGSVSAGVERGGGMVGRAALNPLNYSPAVRALFRALDRWVVDDVAPPPSAYPRSADGTLTPPDRAGWPAVPGYQLPQQPLRAFHLNFGPDWSKGIVSVEPPEVGKPFVVRVPGRGRRRQRARRHPPAGHRGAAGDAGGLELSRRVDRRAGSSGGRDRVVHSVRAQHAPTASAPAIPRPSIEERYRNRDEYVGKARGRGARSRPAAVPAVGRRRRHSRARNGALAMGHRD